MQLTFVDNLRGGMVVAQDVLAPEDLVPMLRANSILTTALIERLRLRGIRFVYIDEALTAERDRVRDEPYVKQNLYIPEPRPILTPRFREDAVASLKDMFVDVASGARDVYASSAQVAKHLDNVVRQMVDTLIAEQNALVNISDLKSYNEYTFHHSSSVAVLSISVGHKLGFNRNSLYHLGMAAMMHDIGKITVPVEVENKRGRLDEREYAMIKNHSPAGYEQLVRTGIGDEELWRSVLFHHEKVDGTGYPYGIGQEEIPVSSRIMAVADVYDALTSDRPYRTPVQPGDALEYIMGSVGVMFDYDMVSAFVNKIELYPIGSYVELSDGNTAVVLMNDNPLRPVVRVMNTNEVWDLNRDRQCLNIVVRRQLIAPKNASEEKTKTGKKSAIFRIK